jgi:biotin carboxyl carrier protein
VVLLVDLELVLDGKTYTAHVEGRKVVINGMEYTIEEKEGAITVDGTSYSVKIQNNEALINGIPHALEVKSKIPAKTEKKVSAAPGAVTAMMPGKIVDVPVKEGDTIQKGDVVCILEAMKMENELHAPKKGTIKKIHVKEGDNVEKGDVLVEIE